MKCQNPTGRWHSVHSDHGILEFGLLLALRYGTTSAKNCIQAGKERLNR